MAKDDGLKARFKDASKSTDSHKQKPEVASASSKIIGFAPMITLLLFSTAMLVFPLLTYFAIRHYIVKSTTIAAMGAIVMVQIIVAVYIYKAWHDENKDHEAQMREKLKKR